MTVKRILKGLLVRYGTWLPDKFYLQLRFRLEMGAKLNLKNPQTFQEKIQWLKLYNRKPEYTQMVDKYAAKAYVTERIGEQYVIPTIGVWNRPEDIDFAKLPDKFVLKTTHGGGGGGVVVCTDKTTLDIGVVKNRLNRSLSTNIYRTYKEWPYKNVPRRIIAEQMLLTPDGTDLKDYKFFCFNGEVKFFKVDFDRFVEHHANYYAPDWTLLPFGEIAFPPVPDKGLEKPDNFDNMLKIAEELSAGFPFLRVDLFNVAGQIFFGELTFFPASGMTAFTPAGWDETIGGYLTLPR